MDTFEIRMIPLTQKLLADTNAMHKKYDHYKESILSLELTDKFELKNNIYLAEVNIENLDKNYKENNRYIALSQYPYVKFDLSFSVPLDFKANDIKSFIEDELVDNENEIDIFDDFVSEKSRNLGIRINTRNYLKTYDEQETTELLNMLIKKVESKFKVKLNKS